MDLHGIIENRIAEMTNPVDLDSLSSRLSIIQVTKKRFDNESYEKIMDLIYAKRKLLSEGE